MSSQEGAQDSQHVTRTGHSYQQPQLRLIAASASYERIADLPTSTPNAQAIVELVRRRPVNPIRRFFRPSEELFVRKTYWINDSIVHKYLLSEYEILSKLEHPNVVQYADFEQRQKKSRWTASLYMEYCSGGDLTQYTSRRGQPGKSISEEQFWHIFFQLASALFYCHTGLEVYKDGEVIEKTKGRRPVLHRDIKPSNVVISSIHDNEIHVKLCDFGLAKYQMTTFSGSFVGTRTYLAPEITDDAREWTPKADIYSLGKTMQHLNCPERSSAATAIIEQCICSDKKRRLSSIKGIDVIRDAAGYDNGGHCMLYRATVNGNMEIVNRLLEAGADPDAATVDGITPLHTAAHKGHFDIVNRLLEAGADPRVASTDGSTPLYTAAHKGHFDIVNRLLEAGADPRTATVEGSTALHAAANSGHLNIVNRLLEAGADLRAALVDGFAPLYFAVQEDHFDIVNRLLEAGADPDAATADGIIPLHFAAQEGYFNIINRLLEAGADPRVAAADGLTPLQLAAQQGHFDIVNRLLEAGADPRAAGPDDCTPLYIAAQEGHLNIVNRLLETGADPQAAMSNGSTPLSVATLKGHLNIVNRLLEAGADPNHPTATDGSLSTSGISRTS